MSNQVYSNSVKPQAYFPNTRAVDVLTLVSPVTYPDAPQQPAALSPAAWANLTGMIYNDLNGTLVGGLGIQNFLPYQSSLTADSYRIYRKTDAADPENGIQIHALKDCVLFIKQVVCYKKTTGAGGNDKSTFFIWNKRTLAGAEAAILTQGNLNETNGFPMVRELSAVVELKAGEIVKFFGRFEGGAGGGDYMNQRNILTISKLN